MRVIVLGAGVVGIASAWFLNKAGHEVTVIDRQPEAGLETSFANGGQVTVSHAEPWANPSAPRQILKWLGREDAPLLFRLRADPWQWAWGIRFLRECTPARTHGNIGQIVTLSRYSQQTLRSLQSELGIEFDNLRNGILHFYTSEASFAAAHEPARIMREFGCDIEVISARECVKIEPALRHAQAQIVGGSITRSDESGDAHRFTQALAAHCAKAGVRFHYGRQIAALVLRDRSIESVRVCDPGGRAESISADAYVVALGSYSAPMLRPVGVRLAVYPAKGYSVTLPVIDEESACRVSLTDDDRKLVFSRLGDRLRVAGTAEFSGYDTRLNEVRCQAIVSRVQELFPGAVDAARARFWTGLRPATPSNVPYIGGTRLANLYLNTGHGTLGWTQACGSGRALADIVSGRRPEIDFAFTGTMSQGPAMVPVRS